jgi:hypothetical protein
MFQWKKLRAQDKREADARRKEKLHEAWNLDINDLEDFTAAQTLEVPEE